MSDSIVNEKGEFFIPAPKIACKLFQAVIFSWLQVMLLLYLAATRLPAGWGKINTPAWMGGTAWWGLDGRLLPKLGTLWTYLTAQKAEIEAARA